jgi:hypothetical protein
LIEEGSTISWAGDPGKGNINLTASSIIRTASSGLVANEIYSLPEEEKNQFNKPLPYVVKIMISNRIEEPEIHYLIDLPQEDKNAFPLVATKLIRLKEPGNESKLTQQVFGLLTIGSFIPERGGDSGSYGSALATTAAANSLNGMLTNEINKLSGQYLKIVDLNVGLQTYADVTAGNSATRTSMDINLSKKLYNDRLTLEAQSSLDIQGNNNTSAATDYSMIHNDFAIIYDLNKQRDLKLKAFDRSSYDLIYKEIRVSGIALIFIKEFDPSGSRKNDR